MMEFLREFVSTLPARLGYGGTIMLLGMAIVFIGLVILIVCIRCLSAVLSLKKEKTEAKQDAPVVVPAPVAQAAAAQTGASADELVAIITAALMAYTATEQTAGGSGRKLVVRNIRAVAAQQAAWARAGRTNQINSRF